jgi:hypothetical protein
MLGPDSVVNHGIYTTQPFIIVFRGTFFEAWFFEAGLDILDSSGKVGVRFRGICSAIGDISPVRVKFEFLIQLIYEIRWAAERHRCDSKSERGLRNERPQCRKLRDEKKCVRVCSTVGRG